jgi:TRAP-type mannitol/chloroaromatic compound transport system permease small subunit
MIGLVWTVVYVVSLGLTIICGIAAIVISVAIATGKYADAEAWETAAFLTVVGYLFWLVSREATGLGEPD